LGKGAACYRLFDNLSFPNYSKLSLDFVRTEPTRVYTEDRILDSEENRV